MMHKQPKGNIPADKHPHGAVRLILSALLLLGLLAGCGKDDLQGIDDGRQAADLYYAAKASMDSGNFNQAILTYKQLQSRYPFGRFTEQAQLELAYCFYKSDSPENAISTLDRFMRTYPAHPNIDYAFYLKGLVNYEQTRGFLQRLFPGRVRDRDQSGARQAFNDFNELLRRYPDSRYAPDARQRMVFLKNNMAAYEVEVARYYQRRGAHVAASNRARYIIETYQNTPEAESALEILHQSYEALELTTLADDALRVLALNYPDNLYLQGREKKESWASKLWPFD